MDFSQRLITLRRQAGMSQEDLAGRMDVSRQAVSKWEGGQAMPDVAKLVALSELFEVTLDFLLKGVEVHTVQPQAQGHADEAFEYVSPIKIGSWPLVHVKFRRNGLGLARGIIAVGNAAVGVFACGGIGLGLISFSGVGAGLISLGGVALGLFALGGVAIGGIALGAVSIGVYGFGAAVIASKLGLGAVVHAPAAIAQAADAEHLLSPEQVNPQTLSAFLDAYVPDMPRFLRTLMTRQ